MKKLIFIFVLTAVFSAAAFAQTKPDETLPPPTLEWVESESDICTWFPDGNYEDCCVAHDREYFFGGSWKERWRSDKKLFQCVWSKPKFYNKIVAPVMWLGVRVFGVPWLKTKASWGFGKKKKPSDKTPKRKKPQT